MCLTPPVRCLFLPSLSHFVSADLCDLLQQTGHLLEETVGEREF